MNADPKRKPHQGDHDRANRARRYQEEALDDALKNTFPASDPVSIGQPTPPTANHDRVKTNRSVLCDVEVSHRESPRRVL
jgi:hypothetical protein